MKVFNLLDVVSTASIRTQLRKVKGCLYRIHQISLDKNYIGIGRNLYSRFYGVWGYIPKIESRNDLSPIHEAIKKYGYSDFELIVELEGDYDLASSKESDYITLYDSTTKGYNMTSSGKGGRKDLVYMNDGSKNIRIPRPDVDKYVSLGFSIGQMKGPNKGKIHVIKGDDLKFIYPNQLDEYLSLGYRLGSKPKVKSKKVTNGDMEKRLPIEKIDEFLKEHPDWRRGGLTWDKMNNRRK